VLNNWIAFFALLVAAGALTVAIIATSRANQVSVEVQLLPLSTSEGIHTT